MKGVMIQKMKKKEFSFFFFLQKAVVPFISFYKPELSQLLAHLIQATGPQVQVHCELGSKSIIRP